MPEEAQEQLVEPKQAGEVKEEVQNEAETNQPEEQPKEKTGKVCSDCEGSGLKDQDTLCPVCEGSGSV